MGQRIPPARSLVSKILVLILSAAFFLTPAAAAQAARRAIVVGIDHYDHLPPNKQLWKAVNDARAIGKALAGLGFSVEPGENVDRKEFSRLWAKFKSSLSHGDVAVFYYSGHAVELGGANYLVPRDVEAIRGATEESESILRDSSINLSDLLAELRTKHLQVSLQIIDACRENPFANAAGKNLGGEKGLSRIEQPEGNFIMYSAGARQQALDRLSDNDRNPNSVYTRSLLPLLSQRGLSLTDMAKKVRAAARDLAVTVGHEQNPAYYDGLTNEFYLAGEPDAEEEVEREWKGVDKTSVAELTAFLAHYRSSRQAKYAQARLDDLNKPKEKAPELQVPITSHTPEQLAATSVGDTVQDCANCPEMVVVPAGSFTMGSSADEPERESGEGPQHRVTIAKPFAVGRFPVTVNQFETFIHEANYKINNGCRVRSGGEWTEDSARSFRSPGFEQDGSHPVVCVNWDDAKAYVKWLSEKTGKVYRLLSEAEREYAARAETTTPFWWGQSITPDLANYNGGIDPYKGGGKKGEWRQKTVPVKSFTPNRWKLYQVHGNVWEWTEDCRSATYSDTPTDGSAYTSGECNYRMVRGGSWYAFPRFLRSASRGWDSTTSRSSYSGFRVARTLFPAH